MSTNKSPVVSLGPAECRVWIHLLQTPSLDGCWLWHRGRTKEGYGAVWYDRMQYAHRIAYE